MGSKIMQASAVSYHTFCAVNYEWHARRDNHILTINYLILTCTRYNPLPPPFP